ncbi:MAG TPA: MlaD family protein [Actinomycetota bacterium]|nr:MlaD family protein [Actinomycetota bacterium]
MRRVLLAAALVVSVLGGSACARPGGTTIHAEFDDVGDLVTRANVQSRDAVIGTVSSIELREREGEPGWLARVTLTVDEGAPIPEGTTAVVRSTSLLGEKFVDLVPPEDVAPDTPRLPDGAVIPLARTDKAPELEEVFQELGGLLASGALADLGTFVTAQARILEGRSEEVGRVLDGTARVVDSLAGQRQAIAQALDNLRSTAATLAAGTDTTNRFLTTTDQALGVLVEQRGQLESLLLELDRFSAVGSRLLEQHSDEMDRQIKALLQIVPKVHEARAVLDQAIPKLTPFALLFARAIPGDYIQLDIYPESPLPVPHAGGSAQAVGHLWGTAAGERAR